MLAFIFAIGGFLLPSPVFADSGGACPSIDDLDDIVISCGSNEKISAKARECADEVISGWKAAAAELQKNLTENSSSQSATELETKLNYDKTLKTLAAQIALMQERTALIADYVQVMVDVPSAGDDEASLSCFNDAFHSIENKVKDLDEEILKAKEIYEKTADMRDSATTRHAHLDQSVFDGVLSGKTISVGPGTSTNRISDVTGLEETKRKESEVGEPVVAVEPVAAVEFKPRNRKAPPSQLTGSSHGSTREQILNVPSFKEELPGPDSGVEVSFDRKPSADSVSGSYEDPVAAALHWERELSNSQKANGGLNGNLAHVASAKVLAQKEEAAEFVGVQDSIRVAVEKDLFSLVRNRYRASELFRDAH